MPAKDVKAYVKRNKNDAADAEPICETVRRPTMRFVRVITPAPRPCACRQVSARLAYQIAWSLMEVKMMRWRRMVHAGSSASPARTAARAASCRSRCAKAEAKRNARTENSDWSR